MKFFISISGHPWNVVSWINLLDVPYPFIHAFEIFYSFLIRKTIIYVFLKSFVSEMLTVFFRVFPKCIVDNVSCAGR